MDKITGPRGVVPNGNKGPPVNIRCPYCGQNGSFQCPSEGGTLHWLLAVGTPSQKSCYAGPRICPNAACFGLVFVYTKGHDVVVTLPTQRLDFSTADVPDEIAASMAEAVACHSAEAYRATALMVRRVLEEICAHKNAQGRNLKERLLALGNQTLVPAELLSAADELRVLGNDAAHVEARDYDNIGRAEAELGVELAKEIVKAVYQYGSLVGKLRALRATTSGTD